MSDRVLSPGPSVGLISDIHATPAPVAEALAIFRREGVDHILCAGDIAGYGGQLDETVALLIDSGCRTIRGNHELMHLEQAGEAADSPTLRFIRQLPATLEITIAGMCLYMVHAHPPDACNGGIKLLDRSGGLQPDRLARWTEKLRDFACDVLVVGHTHQVFAERLGETLVVNPGSTAFNHTCAILRFPELNVEVFPLSGKAPLRTWNWGEHVICGE